MAPLTTMIVNTMSKFSTVNHCALPKRIIFLKCLNFDCLALWYRSIWRGGSVAIFMFAYCIYYYSKSNMSGFMQSTFFFCYNFLLCYAFFLMLATVSFRSSWFFVQHIYSAVKSEWSSFFVPICITSVGGSFWYFTPDFVKVMTVNFCNFHGQGYMHIAWDIVSWLRFKFGAHWPSL